MSSAPRFSGSIVALVTPMEADGAIDWDCLGQLIEWHVAAKTAAIAIAGTTGESPALSFEEHRELIARTVKLVDKRMPVLAGTGANSTVEAIALTRDACEDGVDACLSVVPYYNKPTQKGLRRHFTAIADAASKPVILYNVPGRTVVDLADNTVLQLSEHKMIAGIKDATGDINRLRIQLKLLQREDFCYLSGDDSTACEYMLAGGHGMISVTANIAPAMCSRMATAARAEDRDGAVAIDDRLMGFNQLQGCESNPIPIKWALREQGKIGPGIRLPLTELHAKYHQGLRLAIQGLE